MTPRAFKVAVTGAHSSGKSTFLVALRSRLEAEGLAVGTVRDLASKARDAGLPILRDHTVESTLWIMAETMRQEAQLAMTCQVILVDRPVSDALAYLLAALEVSGRQVEPSRRANVRAIARAHTQDYDLLLSTVLDESLPLGDGRDPDPVLRLAAAKHTQALAFAFAARTERLTPQSSKAMLDRAVDLALDHCRRT